MAEVSDEILMERVKQGNLSVLSDLFERYHVKLYNFFLKLTHDRTESQDLTQNLFYRILKYRNTFNRELQFKSWIYQMARNVHIDNIKVQKRTMDRLQFIENYEENLTEHNDPYDEDEFERLNKALLKLHPEQLNLLVLSRYQGLNYEEISKINNSSIPAIKVQVHRAIKHLREIYFRQI